MLSSNKAYISYQDIEKLVYDISHLWNLMTDAKAIASTQYISQIYNLFDSDGDGIINFNDYFIIYQYQHDIFGWYEFLNYEGINSEEMMNNYKSTKINGLTTANQFKL